MRSGAPWRDLPERYGPRTTCYNRFNRWRKAGVWDRLMDAISAAHDGAIQMIDSTSIRAHQQAATANIGGSACRRNRAGSYCRRRSHHHLFEAWPRDNARARARFAKLKDAYVKARFSKHYRITEEELNWLAERVDALERLVHEDCSARIAELRAAL